MWPFTNRNYRFIIDSKRSERARLISAAPQLNASDNIILRASAREIVQHIESGDWTAVEVVRAYAAQAAVAHAATNCVTEVLFESALEKAKKLDDEFAATKKLRGPLHGVPFSAKDQYEIAGFDVSVGFTQWANNPATTNAALINQLISLGAIPIVKTNIPQTMFSFECNNPLWGRTTNPYNDKYTCGGSTGGEGALLAMDGAVFGLGSDIGGSLRIPTSFCGVFSIKPTTGRVSSGGVRTPTPGFEGIPTVMGPMSRSVEDIELFCKSIFSKPDNDADHRLIPLPYREYEVTKKLRFGYYTSDGFVKASPANRRAIHETVNALTKQGHECVEIELPDATEAMTIFLGLTSSDSYRKMTSHLGPDPLDKTLWLPIYGSRLPGFLRGIALWVLGRLLGDTKFASIVGAARTKSFGEYTSFMERKQDWNRLFYEKVWHRYDLDGIIAPVQAMPQIPHGGAVELGPLAVGTVLYNVVDSPVGVVPVTRVDASKDGLTPEWTGKDTVYGGVLADELLYKAKKPYYDPKGMEGMPIGVQVVGKKYEDEKVIAMMKVVDGALGKGRGFGPCALKRE